MTALMNVLTWLPDVLWANLEHGLWLAVTADRGAVVLVLASVALAGDAVLQTVARRRSCA